MTDPSVQNTEHLLHHPRLPHTFTRHSIFIFIDRLFGPKQRSLTQSSALISSRNIHLSRTNYIWSIFIHCHTHLLRSWWTVLIRILLFPKHRTSTVCLSGNINLYKEDFLHKLRLPHTQLKYCIRIRTRRGIYGQI